MERMDGKMRARLLLATAPIREMRSLRSGTTTANKAVSKKSHNDGMPTNHRNHPVLYII